MIVGCGAIAGGVVPPNGFSGRPALTHAEGYRAHDSFEIVACVDPDPSGLEHFQALWDVPRGYGDLGSALQDIGEVDVVSICSPSSFHEAQALQVLSSQARAVFIEKPVAENQAGAQRIEAAAVRAGKPVAVNFPRRWAPGFEVLRQELQSGVWGEVRNVVGAYNKGLRNNGSHHLDLVGFLFGVPIAKAAGWPRFDDHSDDPTFDVWFSLPCGATFFLAATNADDYAVFDLMIYAQNGRIFIDELGFKIRRVPTIESPVFPGYSVLGAEEATQSGLESAMLCALDGLERALSNGGGLASDITTAAETAGALDDAVAMYLRHDASRSVVSGIV